MKIPLVGNSPTVVELAHPFILVPQTKRRTVGFATLFVETAITALDPFVGKTALQTSEMTVLTALSPHRTAVAPDQPRSATTAKSMVSCGTQSVAMVIITRAVASVHQTASME